MAREAAARRQMEVAKPTWYLSERLFKEGLVGFIGLLDNRRRFLSARQAMAESLKAQLIAKLGFSFCKSPQVPWW